MNIFLMCALLVFGNGSPCRSSARPPSPYYTLHQIRERLMYLHTGLRRPAGSIIRGTPQSTATALDLRNVYSNELTPPLYPTQANSLTCQLDMIEEVSPPIVVPKTSDGSADSLEVPHTYTVPQFVISCPTDPVERSSITKGIGKKSSLAREHPDEPLFGDEAILRHGSDKSLGFSDDSLSNDSANLSPTHDHNTQAIFSNTVSTSSGYSEQRGSFSDTPRTSFSAQSDIPPDMEQIQRSTMDLKLHESRPHLSLMNVSYMDEHYEISLSTISSQLDSTMIVQLLKETFSSKVPPQNMFAKSGECQPLSNSREALTGYLNLEYSGGIQIEVLVCEDRTLEKKGLKMRRVSGDHHEYGRLCQQLIDSLTV